MKTITRLSLGLALAIAAWAVAGSQMAAQDQERERSDRPFMGRRGGPGASMGRRGGPGASMGRRGGPGAFRGPGGPFMLPLRRLNLTDVQRDQVRSIFESHREETQSLAERARAAREALHAAVAADTFEEGTIRARSSDLNAVETDLAISRARLHGEIVGVLTPAQKEELKKLQSERRKRR